MIGCSTVSRSRGIHLFFFSTNMADFCTYQGIVQVHQGELSVYSDRRGYSKHNAVVSITQDDLPVDV